MLCAILRCLLSGTDECECGEESDEDVITDYLVPASMDPAPQAVPQGPSPLVPIISVTPHSPAGKNYPILGKLKTIYYYVIIILF